MKVTPTSLPGVVLIEPRVFGDDRGYFLETWSRARYADAGLPEHFVQDNVSRSRRGTLRGLHLQEPHPQGKLVGPLEGDIFDVAVDVRVGSDSFGRWVGCPLSGEQKQQLYVPPGFAHGFCVTSEEALVLYKCTAPYHPEAELVVAWNDPEVGVRWPIGNPTLSERDASAPRLRDIEPERLPHHGR